MSFDDFETSISGGQAVRLYQLDRSVTVVWRYTNADRAITWGGHVYAPLAISDDGIRISGQATADKLTLTLPALAPVAQLFRGTPPSEEIFLTVYDYDAGAADGEVVWIGSITSVTWPRHDTAEINCGSLSASMQREGLRLRYERNCPHSVYDSECGLQKADWAVPVTVTALDGRAVHVTGAGALDQFQDGAVEWPRDGTVELRGIERAGDGLALFGGTGGLQVGQAVALYPGCDGSRATCNGRFNNIDNHGGFPHMPGKSIFDGERLW
jgi:uncharacterized phage protein (TIGR02218 family)